MKFECAWRRYMAFLACCLALTLQAGLAAQAPSQSPRPVGVVVAIEASGKRITLKTDAGPEMGIQFHDATRFLRVAPGSQDLSGAARITPSDLSVNDRILVRGRSGGEANSFVADAVIVMSRADLARKQEADRADWEKRGIGGVITALDLASRETTIREGGPKSSKAVVLELTANAKLRRYSPDSIRFSDARASSFEDLKLGDQVKARGARSADGSRFRVEELVSGSFRDFAATVVAVDAGQGTLQVMDLAAKTQVEARVQPASNLRRLSPAAVQMLTRRISGATESNNSRELQSTIEASPSISLTELKPGEPVVISGMNSGDPAKLTAITVLAGVEPLLKPSTRGARPPDIGSWNLDLNMGVGVP